MKKFFSDFKAFISKGNILDMAVGVVVGGAFSKIVSSLVADIINPLIGLATGDAALNELKWILQEKVATVGADGAEVIEQAEIALNYGNFLQTVIDFLIIAFSIFVVLRIMMNAQKKMEALKHKEVVEEAPAEPTTKVCPFCQSEISVKATRCPHCTSELTEQYIIITTTAAEFTAAVIFGRYLYTVPSCIIQLKFHLK